MRDIRFRAWDGKTMRTDFWLEFNGNLCQWDSHELLFNGGIKGIEVMQYTGLKDKNGKEIYEGDIVSDARGLAVPVIWSDEQAKFAVKHKEFEMGILQSITENWEVIGDIYSNPELLATEAEQ